MTKHCTHCNGTGFEKVNVGSVQLKKCLHCKGTGYRRQA